MEVNRIYCGDALSVLKTFPDSSINCCVTSPPYWGLRDYSHDAQIGMEETPGKFVQSLVEIFTEVNRVLKPDGTLWLNLGDSYASNSKGSGGPSEKQDTNAGIRYATKKFNHGVKEKDLVGIPWMVAFALRTNGWYLRQDIIWHKPNPMPESVTDRCTKSHEYIFLMSKSAKYYFDAEAIKTPSLDPTQIRSDSKKTFPTKLINGIRENKSYEMANKRSVWSVHTQSFSDAHFATFPEELIVDCIKAGCPENGIVLDPFMGTGTTAFVARKLDRNYIGIELNPEYVKMAERRIGAELGMFT